MSEIIDGCVECHRRRSQVQDSRDALGRASARIVGLEDERVALKARVEELESAVAAEHDLRDRAVQDAARIGAEGAQARIEELEAEIQCGGDIQNRERQKRRDAEAALAESQPVLEAAEKVVDLIPSVGMTMFSSPGETRERDASRAAALKALSEAVRARRT